CPRRGGIWVWEPKPPGSDREMAMHGCRSRGPSPCAPQLLSHPGELGRRQWSGWRLPIVDHLVIAEDVVHRRQGLVQVKGGVRVTRQEWHWHHRQPRIQRDGPHFHLLPPVRPAEEHEVGSWGQGLGG